MERFEALFGDKGSQLLSQKLLHAVDLFFAKRLYPNGDDEPLLFLAYLLSKAREGHLCVSIENGLINPSLGAAWDPLLVEGASRLPSLERFIVRSENRFYLKRHWECEERFLKHWRRLKEQIPFQSISVDWLAGELDKLSLEAEQKSAILKAAGQSLTVICGGPGTGKTFTAATLVRLFRQALDGEIALAAPTGKAAANLRSIQEKGVTVETLHSLLKKRYLSADLVLVDEGSMVDAELMATLFERMKEGARLVLLGDRDQLPPVESGHFFADLSTDPLHLAELKRCLRTELEEIVLIARNVKEGKAVPFHSLPSLKNLITMIADRLPFEEEMNASTEKKYQSFRVLCPLRQGLYGIDRLNALLLEEHRVRAKRKSLRTVPLPIMITVNDPANELFNGDTGFLVETDRCAYFPGGKVVPVYQLPRYEYAYVMSVHKSQGSEYEHVMILLPEGSEVFAREMLYTAVTRAKKGVEIYAEEKTLMAVLSKQSRRLSGMNLSH